MRVPDIGSRVVVVRENPGGKPFTWPCRVEALGLNEAGQWDGNRLWLSRLDGETPSPRFCDNALANGSGWRFAPLPWTPGQRIWPTNPEKYDIPRDVVWRYEGSQENEHGKGYRITYQSESEDYPRGSLYLLETSGPEWRFSDWSPVNPAPPPTIYEHLLDP